MSSTRQKRVLGISCLISASVVLILHDKRIPVPRSFLGINQGPDLTEVLEERTRVLRKGCQHHNQQIKWQDARLRRSMKSHVWDFMHGLVYCPIAKVASTTWYWNFLEILDIQTELLKSMKESRMMPLDMVSSFMNKGSSGKISKIDYRVIVNNLTTSDTLDTDESLQVLGVMKPFLIVRHPFSRLVSAYEDKILNPAPNLKYHKMIQGKIKGLRKEGKTYKIEFPKYLLAKEKYQRMLKRKVTTIDGLNSQPSFAEFISWILLNRQEKDNSPASWAKEKSWNPLYSVCPVCQVDYAVIKLDGERNEFDSWLSYNGLNVSSVSAHTDGKGKSGSAERAVKYFSELTKDEVVQLYKLYKADFDLFSYDPETYIDVAQGSLSSPWQESALSDVSIDDDIEGRRIKNGLNERGNSGQALLERAKLVQQKRIDEFNKKFEF